MTTKPNTVTRPATLEGWLQALTGAMTCTHRPNGTSYWHLSEAAYWEPIRDDLTAVCMAAHREEFPNDWRWEAINDLANQLLVWSEADSDVWEADRFFDVSFSIADDLADYGTCQLAAWLSDHAGRAEFEDPSLVEGLTPNLFTLMRWRQCEELQLMAEVLISRFEDLLPD
jgi:hypothetical protein